MFYSDFLAALILAAPFVVLAAVRLADWIDGDPLRRSLRVRTVGGLTHWRMGRVGGSFYRARA